MQRPRAYVCSCGDQRLRPQLRTTFRVRATLIARNPVHYGFEVEYEEPLSSTRWSSTGLFTEHLSLAERRLRSSDPAPAEYAITPRQALWYELKVPCVPIRGPSVVLRRPTATFPSPPPRRARETLSRLASRYRCPSRRCGANVPRRRPGPRDASSLYPAPGGGPLPSVATRGNASRGPWWRRKPAELAGRRAPRTLRCPSGRYPLPYRGRHGTTVATLLPSTASVAVKIRPARSNPPEPYTNPPSRDLQPEIGCDCHNISSPAGHYLWRRAVRRPDFRNASK